MSKQKTKVKGQKLSAKQLQTAVRKLLAHHAKKQFNPKQIKKKLEVLNNKDSINYALEQLVERKEVRALGDYKFQINNTDTDGTRQNGQSRNGDRKSRSGDRRGSEKDRRGSDKRGKGDRQTAEGRVDMTRSGSAFIVVEGLENDIFVNQRKLGSALNGDTVKVQYWQTNRKKRPEGQVVAVTERAADHFLGEIQVSKNYAFVIPNKLNMPLDIYVDLADTKGAKDGDKVVVKVTSWPEKPGKSPRGKVTSVLGATGSSDIEMKAILINNGFNLEFPEAVIAESEDLRDVISLQEVHRRRDMRDVTTFTIDPHDAKDFDDALSIQWLDDDLIEVGVHIADVSHYVKTDSALDKEAYERCTSVYLVDRVLPMLPERISNELCSLRPHEDKCTFSAIFKFTPRGKIVDRWFGKTVIHSDHRFAYEEAQKVLDGEDDTLKKELLQLNKFALKLRKERFKNGAIDFDSEEVRFKLDEDGVPIDVYVKERRQANMLIEDWMLLANREVATFISKKGKKEEIPFVYRVHDEPDLERVEEFAAFARDLGFEVDTSSPRAIAKSYNALTKAASEDEYLKLIQPIAIRTMAKAIYTTENIGHYGLGFDNYTHFTSPIRRYSDVLVHRILEENLGDKTLRVNKAKLEEKCGRISLRERAATAAERESIKYKQVEYMEKHIGETFDGIVNGIIDRGIFVEVLGTMAEGLAGFERMSEGFNVDGSRLFATGIRTGQKIKMGDPVQVKIVAADLTRRQIEMELVED